MSFWTKIKSDLEKGIDDGIALVKEGATVVLKKVEVVSEEGKRLYSLYDLKAKVRNEIAELGGKVYDLSSKLGNPFLDSKVKAIVGRIKNLEDQIVVLEDKKAPAAKKTARKPAAKKSVANKPAAKKTTEKEKAAPKPKQVKKRVAAKDSKAAVKKSKIK